MGKKTAVPEPARPTKKRILLVEDHPIFRHDDVHGRFGLLHIAERTRLQCAQGEQRLAVHRKSQNRKVRHLSLHPFYQLNSVGAFDRNIDYNQALFVIQSSKTLHRQRAESLSKATKLLTEASKELARALNEEKEETPGG